MADSLAEIKSKLESTFLLDKEVNRQIQKKIYKVSSSYGEGTGYIIDDDNGIILSSFHLVGGIKPVTIHKITQDRILISILYAAKFIDDELRLTKKALELKDKKELIEAIQGLAEINEINYYGCVDPQIVKDLLANIDFKKWLLNEIQSASTRKDRQFNCYDIYQSTIAVALMMAGYLDHNLRLTEKPLSFENLEKGILAEIPLTKTFHVLFNQQKLDAKVLAEAKEKLIKNAEQYVLFFAKKEKEVVLLSDTVEIECGEEILIGRVKFPERMGDKIQTILKNFAYFDAVPIQIIKFKEGPDFTAKRKVIRTGKEIQPLPEDEELPEVGEKVYFGGFPLTQQVYTFSAGIISAVTNTSSGTRRCFVLEAPIAPGNSGSPVFIQRNGQVYFIGIINSEVASVSEKMLDIREKTLQMPGEVMRAGGLGFLGAIRELTTTLLDNLMTGKGKAFEVRSLSTLYDLTLADHSEHLIDPFLDFLVPKKKQKNEIRERVKREIDERRSVIFELFEYGGKTYNLCPDNHGNKHTKNCKAVYDGITHHRTYLKDNWGKTPATFNPTFAKYYRENLKKVIIAVAKNGEKSNFVCFGVEVGWDTGTSKHGEATDVVELYYEDQGSHCRPKARSRLKETDIVIGLDEVATEKKASAETKAREEAGKLSKEMGGGLKPLLLSGAFPKGLEKRNINMHSELITALGKCKAKDEENLPTPELALRRASANGYIETVKTLLKHVKDIDVNQPGPSGKTAIQLAKERNKMEIVEYLKSVGAKLESVEPADKKETLVALRTITGN